MSAWASGDQPPFAAIAFDLDGTLIDSRRDIQTAVNRLRGENGAPALSLAAVTAMIGEGARVLVDRALPAEFPRQHLDEAVRRYLEHYAEVCLETTTLYPGVEAMTRELAAVLPLAILTNKPEGLSRRILAALGVEDAFAAIIGGDTLPSRKPNPEGLVALVRELGRPTGRLALIGDSRVDAETAAVAGVPFGLVLWSSPHAIDGFAVRWRFASPTAVTAAFTPSAQA